ncbi:MAG: DUF3866 family protein [Coriobacteriia bacterium]|nr:DUF3866 family protein [Coriobacteriia bacterium]
MRLVWGIVKEIYHQEDDIAYIAVQSAGFSGENHLRPALLYTQLLGMCKPGDKVLVNCTALDLRLGTGGYDFVLAIQNTKENQVLFDNQKLDNSMKLRYTPLQSNTALLEDEASFYHELLAEADSISGMPVVACELHSQVFLVAQAIKTQKPQAKLAYIYTDQGALLASISKNLRQAQKQKLIDWTITAGQALGGDFEVQNIYTGLLAAKHVLQADLAIIAIGPGISGTATKFGHGGVLVGEYVNATASLGGIPIACLRISEADKRRRHQGVSHHSLVALSHIALACSHIAIPEIKDEQVKEKVFAQLDESGILAKHICHEFASTKPDSFGLEVLSMGRPYSADPVFFEASYAAGYLAASFIRA